MPIPPLLLEPILKERVWGGRRLTRLGKRLPDDVTIGESWEVADLPDTVAEGRSVVLNGPLAGRTLREAIGEHREAIMGGTPLTPDGGFPLLIKYLDARENLSVQVHPTPDYVRLHPEAHLKTEAWVIIEAEPEALLYKGLRPGVTPAALVEAIGAHRVVDVLCTVPARVGDCHYLPSGTCHALGAGIVVAEIQTPSDTTFRIYDWGRAGRALHIDSAIACIEFDAGPAQVTTTGEPITVGDMRTTQLLDKDHFAIAQMEAGQDSTLPVVTDGHPMIWMIVEGSGRLAWTGGHDLTLNRGTTVLIPAALDGGEARLEAGCRLLQVTPPSAARGTAMESTGGA